MKRPLFKKVDCYLMRVTDLDAALDFYGNKLGHKLAWRKGNKAASLKMPGTDCEIVFKAEMGKPEIEFLVESVPAAVKTFTESGGKVLRKPFDIDIGKCAAVQDPFGNVIVLIDTTKGLYRTDRRGNVVGLKRIKKPRQGNPGRI